MVLAIYILVIEVIKKDILAFNWIVFIYFLIYFKNNKIQTFINFSNKLNIITTRYNLKLGLKVYPSNIKIKKNDDFTLEIFEIVVASF